jgi:hypothetical protein
MAILTLFHLLVKSVKKTKAISLLSAVFKPSLLPIKSLAEFLLGILLQGLKRRGRETDGLYSRNVDVRNAWAVISLSHTP